MRCIKMTIYLPFLKQYLILYSQEQKLHIVVMYVCLSIHIRRQKKSLW